MIDPATIDLNRFWSYWHGQPTDSPTPLPDSCAWLPKPLREWHENSSQWDANLTAIKSMTPPQDISIVDRKATFMSEDGGGIWAFSADDPSIVLEGKLYGEWMESAESLSEFLIHNALQETAFTATHWRFCDEVPDAILPRVLAPMEEVSFSGWNWPHPGFRIFLGEGLVADVGPSTGRQTPWAERLGYSEVQIGATTCEALAYLDDLSNISWVKPYFT
ncbi:hypothetical protein [Peterkaempfera sp. SMS 1(5)a]|uniref:hypothetical protein n=1 Tax=Peterkaempfera podocarpi TaxID=3232308 RepID=UPI00366C67C7